MTDTDAQDQFKQLIAKIQGIRGDMLRLVESSADLLRDVHPTHQQSARNLLHYLALRGDDLRPLQAQLTAVGLSSLGRAESHVLAAIDAVLSVLECLVDSASTAAHDRVDDLDLATGQRLLETNTEAVLGPRPAGRGVSIMVTMPTEAAEDYTLVSRLVEQGMDCMRINCAHDSPADWSHMIDHLRRAEERAGRSCRILMDLAGPKVRTGDLEPGPAVVKFGPDRNSLGRVTAPARVWLFAEEDAQPAPTSASASLPVPGDWVRSLLHDDVIRFRDARGAKRALRVVAPERDGCWVESVKTCYVVPGTVLRIDRADEDDEPPVLEALVGSLPTRDLRISLVAGDGLVVTRSTVPGRNAVRDEQGPVLTPASIGCTADRVFDDVRSGDRIWFDDGKIGGVVERRDADRLNVRVTRTPARGARLASEKGINLPDTDLQLPALTGKDREDLTFVAEHADMVALSFVNSVDDVCELRTRLSALGGPEPAIVLKIETQRGFENLPAMLLEAMKSPRCAVMIARGDLAVECGFERMAEVQEEILWLCEAAHVPVIWATQVLETLAKEGLPSRAEVTDAAMSNRAECVMLNKGPFVVEAVQVLDDILRRMHGHQEKKRPMMRALSLVSSFIESRTSRA